MTDKNSEANTMHPYHCVGSDTITTLILSISTVYVITMLVSYLQSQHTQQYGESAEKV